MKKKPWKRLSQSDSEAVMRLVDEYQSSIKRIIVSVLKGQWPDAVDDILQDTYEEICRQLNLIEEAENRQHIETDRKVLLSEYFATEIRKIFRICG